MPNPNGNVLFGTQRPFSCSTTKPIGMTTVVPGSRGQVRLTQVQTDHCAFKTTVDNSRTRRNLKRRREAAVAVQASKTYSTHQPMFPPPKVGVEQPTGPPSTLRLSDATTLDRHVCLHRFAMDYPDTSCLNRMCNGRCNQSPEL